jgi:hypothetical protein
MKKCELHRKLQDPQSYYSSKTINSGEAEKNIK